jgi:hypothetical protein
MLAILLLIVAFAFVNPTTDQCVGVSQVQSLYNQDLMKECILPILIADWKHLSKDEWKNFCATSACEKTVTALRALPSCTWQNHDDEATRMGTALLQLCP